MNVLIADQPVGVDGSPPRPDQAPPPGRGAGGRYQETRGNLIYFSEAAKKKVFSYWPGH